MNLAGVFSPIPTPFDDRDRVDTARLKAALAKWSTKPLTGFVVLGSNGEAALMDDFECDQAIVAARDAVARDKVFIVGTGRESTQGASRPPNAPRSMAPTRCWCAHRDSSRAR